ncbi:MAG: hypothetical protein AAFW01_10720, partial [Pseudomonadota bacterium]
MNTRPQHFSSIEATARVTTTYQRDTETLLQRVVDHLGFNPDDRFRWIIVAHLFDDTRRMIDALERVIELDAIFGVPYSSNRRDIREAWSERYGDVVQIPEDLPAMEAALVGQLGRSLAACKAEGQRLIVQEVGGFVVPLLHKYFRDDLHLVAGVVEITKQGVWRAQELDLRFPVLHCADSELKRLEAQRCGETIVRCVD